MFWKPRGTKNVRTNRRAKTLRIESLETRQMLSGVVQVNLDGLGNLSLVGDSSQHYVEITSTPNGTYDQFTITSKDGTLFELNGVLPTLTSVAVDGVTGDINVNLGNGGPNTFDFEAPSSNAGAVSTVLGNLTITDNSVETNKINNVVIQGNLTVVDGSNGYHEFDALGTQVNGVTEIDNSGVVTGTPAPGNFSGDSYTNITNCVFEGLSVNTQTAGNTQTVGAAAVTSDASTPLQRQTAIDNGLTYLESQQNADGSWTNSYGYNTATTALVVEALALRGGPGAATNLSNGLNYLLTPSLSGLTVTNLGGKTGVYFSGGEQTYITSIVLPALVTVGGFSTSTGIVDPRTGDVMTRGDVIQAICNQISAGQHTDGGWRYTLSDTADPTPSDNSVSQWASLALLYAQTAGFSDTVNYANLAAFVNSVQSTAPGTNQGGSDYQPGVGWINESKTAGLLVEHNLGLLNGVSDIGNTDLALQYLNAHWLDGGAEGFAANFGSAYAMWSVYKGLESTIGLNNTTTITNLMTPGAANWWDDQCQYLIGTQNGDGSWTDQGEGGFAFAFDPGMTTAIDIMILNGTPIPSGQAPALKIDNGVGNNQVYVRAMSPPPQETSGIDTAQIGYETAATPAAPVALLVNNGLGATASFFGGGSNVTITDPAGSAVPVVYGAVEINNGQTLPLQSNQVNFVGAVVYGGVNVTNQVGGDTSTSIQQSKLGEQLENNAPVQVVNQGSGANQFLMTASELPWGLAVLNDQPSYGNETIIDSSFIGQTSSGAHPQVAPSFSVSGPQSGDVAYISGSTDGVGGPDTVVVRNGTVIRGGLDLQLGSGDKNVALDSSSMSCFEMTTGTGNDQLWIGGTTIQTTVNVTLGSGNDTLWLQLGNTNALSDSLPDPIGGSITVQRVLGGNGVGNLYYDSSDVPGFSLPDTLETLQTDTIPAWALVSSV